MSDEITSLDDIKDPEAFIKEYNRMRENINDLRTQLHDLKEEHKNFSEEAVQKWKDIAVKTQAVSTVQAQGVKDAERIIKLLDLSDVELDDEGKLAGIEQKLEEVKKDFPELFDTKRRVGGKADIHADTPVKPKLTGTEAQVASIFNRH